MKDPQILYVYETPKSVVTSFVVPDVCMAANFRWRKNAYYHPEVKIYLGKSTTVKRRKWLRIEQAIMHALQAEKISVLPLRNCLKQSVHARKRKPVDKRQKRLL